LQVKACDTKAELVRVETIRSYVIRVKEQVLTVDSHAPDDKVEVCARWAPGEADGIDPVHSGRFLDEISQEEDGAYDE
jgi:hypothetical protein